MSALADWQIRNLVTHWPASWYPPDASDGGLPPGPQGAMGPDGIARWAVPERSPLPRRAAPIPNAGPLVDPFDPAMLGPATYDMRIGCTFRAPQPVWSWATRDQARIGRPGSVGAGLPDGSWEADEEMVRRAGATGMEIHLEKGDCLTCLSAEYYRLPPDVRGSLYMRSSAARLWVNHSLASTVQPGFQGRIAFEIVNVGPNTFVVKTGMSLLQIAFERLEAPSESPYFVRADAKYRGQTGVGTPGEFDNRNGPADCAGECKQGGG